MGISNKSFFSAFYLFVGLLVDFNFESSMFLFFPMLLVLFIIWGWGGGWGFSIVVVVISQFC